MYKIYYKIEIGLFESIVDATNEDQTIELIKEDCAKDGYTVQQIKDVFKLEGKGVLTSKFISH